MCKKVLMKQYLLDQYAITADENKKAEILSWPENHPSAIQLLKLLDMCVEDSSTPADVLVCLHDALKNKLVDENITYQELIKKATWRHDGQ